MSICQKTVLLLKSEKTDDSGDKFEDLLILHNFEVILVKTLVFQYKNLSKLKEKLLNAEAFSGLILSSPRCVHATSQALTKAEITDLWGSKSNFAVGETSSVKAIEKLGLNCSGGESGNAERLAQVIINDKTQFTKPFLFPHGNLKTDTLQIELGKANLSLEGVLVYETQANPNVEQEIERATNGFTTIPEFVVFFSPSGFRSSIEFLKKVPINFDLVKIIAIGPVTQLSIENEHLRVYKVAKNPTPNDVLNILK